MKKFIFIAVIATLVCLSLSSCGKKCVCYFSGNPALELIDLSDNDHEFELSDYGTHADCYSIIIAGNAGFEAGNGQIYQLNGNHYDLHSIQDIFTCEERF